MLKRRTWKFKVHSSRGNRTHKPVRLVPFTGRRSAPRLYQLNQKKNILKTSYNKRIRNNRLDLRERFIIVHYVVQAEPKYAQHVNGERYEEEEEEPVVPSSDTVVHPRTVVVKRLEC